MEAIVKRSQSKFSAKVREKIKNTITYFENNFFKISFIVSQFCFCDFALADDPVIGGDNLGTAATKLNTEFLNVKELVWTVSKVAGVIICFKGIVMWVKVSKHQSEHTHVTAGIMIFIGALLVFLEKLISLSGSSVFSS